MPPPQQLCGTLFLSSVLGWGVGGAVGGSQIRDPAGSQRSLAGRHCWASIPARVRDSWE